MSEGVAAGIAPGPLDAEGYVVVERDGSLWGLAGRHVLGLGRLAPRVGRSAEDAGDRPGSDPGEHRSGGDAPATYRLLVVGGELTADRVLAVVPDLKVWPAPGALVRFWSEAATGLAVYDDRPVLVVDGEHPPVALQAPRSDSAAAAAADDVLD